ncbi:MAG: NADPH-dependent F420 reductase [Nitrosopumilaceae archaeon]|nr:NADPH-dependent F420 reductase [Nitrosopumilaceae archaeon]
MRIGIVGGTGGMGRGFALRWSRSHDIIVGSRSAQRAEESAAAYQEEAAQAYGGIQGSVRGTDNVSAAQESDVLLLSIPYENIDSTCPDVLSAAPESCVVVSPVVPMKKTKVGFEFIPLMEGGGGSAHQLIGAHMRDPSRLVSAFHVISEKKLADPKRNLDYDIFVCGDDAGAVDTVKGLIGEISGLRPIYLGGGSLAYMAEISTPILLNAMIRNKIKNPGIKIL